MLIGNTYYFSMQSNGYVTRQEGTDGASPSHVRDSKCKANEIAVWKCTNGPRRLNVAAGKDVRRVLGDDNAILAKLAAAGLQV